MMLTPNKQQTSRAHRLQRDAASESTRARYAVSGMKMRNPGPDAGPTTHQIVKMQRKSAEMYEAARVERTAEARTRRTAIGYAR